MQVIHGQKAQHMTLVRFSGDKNHVLKTGIAVKTISATTVGNSKRHYIKFLQIGAVRTFQPALIAGNAVVVCLSSAYNDACYFIIKNTG